MSGREKFEIIVILWLFLFVLAAQSPRRRK